MTVSQKSPPAAAPGRFDSASERGGRVTPPTILAGEMTLTALANEFGTDKGTIRGASHAYAPFYELLFRPLRDQPISLLEIGLAQPHDRDAASIPSVTMWHAYFKKAMIYGADICDHSHQQTDWFKFVQVDCGDNQQLERINRLGVPFDIIIDDGSHASYHQQLTLSRIFKSLKKGGLYIIEDLHWQPALERRLPRVPKTAQLLADFMHSGRFPPIPGTSEQDWNYVGDHIGGVALIDEDLLLSMQHFFNMRTGQKPEYPHFLDWPFPARVFNRHYARRLWQAGRGFAKAASGTGGWTQNSTIGFAVIQKV